MDNGLLVLGLIPLVGALFVAILGATNASDETAKRTAFGISLIELVVTIVICAKFHATGQVFQSTTSVKWISQFGVHFSLGADGIALVLIALTSVLTPVVLLASWHDASGGRRSVATFFALVLSLQALLVGVFSATDVFLFYVFFEAMLIPMYFLIGSYGGPQRQYAAVKFLLYSLFGGLLMLAAVIGLYVVARNQGHATFDFATLTTLHISKTTQDWLFLGFATAFAVKAPLVPFHTWLPDAGAEAPTGGAVLLVGVLDKVGTFGFLRYCIPLFPDASKTFAPWILGLAVAGILYGALVAIGQRDMKRLVSYTSVAHFGFIALGIFAMTSQGGAGAVLYMVNHGLATGALFLAVGIIVGRTGNRDVNAYGGLAKVAPLLAGAFFISGLASLALPGTNSFVSEFLTLLGTFTRYRIASILATVGIILAALYVLWAYQRVAQGPVRGLSEKVKDLSTREVWVMAPVLALVVVLGVYPKPLLDVITPSVNRTLQQVHRTDPAPTASAGDVGAPASLPDYAPGTSPFLPGGDGRTPHLDVAIGAFK
ncbi:MAG TPA: NADH-quinone oxidoreductase subunit M [Mycobacteriales bacterium]|nr:NADH-quinone oxidoreductase subunit M [Mycobacteriales bacterium]